MMLWNPTGTAFRARVPSPARRLPAAPQEVVYVTEVPVLANWKSTSRTQVEPICWRLVGAPQL